MQKINVYVWCETGERGTVTKAKVRPVGIRLIKSEAVDFFETCAMIPSATCFHLSGPIACEFDLDPCRFDAEHGVAQPELEALRQSSQWSVA